MKKRIPLEYHPNDSRIRMVDEDICQTLSSRMGTGGGNVPLIFEVRRCKEDPLDSVANPPQIQEG